MNKNTIYWDENFVGYVQPNVSVNSGAFIKPTFILCCIYSNYNYIIAFKIDIIRNIVRISNITTKICSDVKSVEPNFGISINSVKLKFETFIAFRFFNGEMFAIPTDTCFWISAANWFVTMTVHFNLLRFYKRKFDNPIVWNVDFLPSGIYKFWVYNCSCINIRLVK